MVRPRTQRRSTGPSNDTPVDPMQQLIAAINQFSATVEKHSQLVSQPSNPPTRDQILSKFNKLHREKFTGEPDAQKAELWLENLEYLFNILRYDDEQKIDLSVFQFEGAARHWWSTVVARWTRTETAKTWENFRTEFLDKYVPRWEIDRRRNEFARLEQGNLTVEQYDAEFTRLLRYVPYYQDDEREKARLFYQGLKPELQTILASADWNTYAQVVERAAMVEFRISESHRSSQPHNHSQELSLVKPKESRLSNLVIQRPRVQQGKKPQTASVRAIHTSGVTLTCDFCGGSKHNEKNCWKKKGKCLACGDRRHQISNCPKKKNQQRRNNNALVVFSNQKNKASGSGPSN